MQKWGFSAIFSRLVHQIDLILHMIEELSSFYNSTIVLLASHMINDVLSALLCQKRGFSQLFDFDLFRVYSGPWKPWKPWIQRTWPWKPWRPWKSLFFLAKTLKKIIFQFQNKLCLNNCFFLRPVNMNDGVTVRMLHIDTNLERCLCCWYLYEV